MQSSERFFPDYFLLLQWSVQTTIVDDPSPMCNPAYRWYRTNNLSLDKLRFKAPQKFDTFEQSIALKSNSHTCGAFSVNLQIGQIIFSGPLRSPNLPWADRGQRVPGGAAEEPAVLASCLLLSRS